MAVLFDPPFPRVDSIVQIHREQLLYSPAVRHPTHMSRRYFHQCLVVATRMALQWGNAKHYSEYPWPHNLRLLYLGSMVGRRIFCQATIGLLGARYYWRYYWNGLSFLMVRSIARVPSLTARPARLTGVTTISARRKRRIGSTIRRRPTNGNARPTETPQINRRENFNGADTTPATVV